MLLAEWTWTYHWQKRETGFSMRQSTQTWFRSEPRTAGPDRATGTCEPSPCKQPSQRQNLPTNCFQTVKQAARDCNSWEKRIHQENTIITQTLSPPASKWPPKLSPAVLLSWRQRSEPRQGRHTDCAGKKTESEELWRGRTLGIPRESLAKGWTIQRERTEGLCSAVELTAEQRHYSLTALEGRLISRHKSGESLPIFWTSRSERRQSSL